MSTEIQESLLDSSSESCSEESIGKTGDGDAQLDFSPSLATWSTGEEEVPQTDAGGYRLTHKAPSKSMQIASYMATKELPLELILAFLITRRAEKRLVLNAVCMALTSIFLGDLNDTNRLPSLNYDVIGGVPVRIIKASPRFMSHTLSADGELLATCDFYGINVYRRKDYALVARARTSNIEAMLFVDGESHLLRAVDFFGNIIDMKVEQSDGDLNSAERQMGDGLRVISRLHVHDWGLFVVCFSKDGNLVWIGQEKIEIFRIEEERVAFHRVLFDPKESDLPVFDKKFSFECVSVVISPNQLSALAVYAKKDGKGDIKEMIIAVWPRLQCETNPETKPVIVKGNRAVWAASGEYLAVWVKEERVPCLKVYKTMDLLDKAIKPIASRTLGPGLLRWQAVGRTSPHRSLLIHKVYKFGKEQYLEWDFEKDAVTNEISMELKSEESGAPWDDKEACEEDLSPAYCADDETHWIASYNPDAKQCTVASCCSGATVFTGALPDLCDSVKAPMLLFDCTGRHLLIVGETKILAFAPAFLQQSEIHPCSSIEIIPDDLLKDIEEDNCDCLYQLGSRAITSSFDEIEKLQSSNGTENIKATDLCTMGLSLNSSVNKFVLLAGADEHDEDPDGDSYFCPCVDGGCMILTNSQFSNEAEEEQKMDVLIMDSQGKTTETKEVSVNLKGCLHHYQTRDRRSLVVLEKTGVCLLDLKSLTVRERIPYQIDFEEVLKEMKEKTGNDYDLYWEDTKRVRRMVSDDGQSVLLAWDVDAQRSIVVTPATESKEIKELIENGKNFSPTCHLTRDGAWTLFTDLKEWSNGRAVIGVYSNKGKHHESANVEMPLIDREVRHKICAAADIPDGYGTMYGLCWFGLFYEMDDDMTSIFVLIVPNKDMALSSGVKASIKTFNIYGTERCIPEYSNLLMYQGNTMSDKVKRFLDRFGSCSALNHPVSKGLSVFQEAFLKEDKVIVQEMIKSAEKEGVKLASRSPGKDILTESLNKRLVQRVEEAIDVITSGVCPIRDRTSLTTRDLSKALQLAPRRVIKALLDDGFVAELCRFEVNVGFLDPTLRRDASRHIVALEDVLDWVLEQDPKALAKMWEDRNSKAVRELENAGIHSTTMASLKVVCIEGPSKSGADGLIRHLLLNDVPENVFNSKVVKWIVSHNWFTIWRAKFIQRAWLHVMFLCCFTIYIIVLGTTQSLNHADFWIKISTSILLVVSAAYGILMTTEETKQITSLIAEGRSSHNGSWWGVHYYLRSKWNWADLTTCLLLVVLIPFFHLLSLFDDSCDQFLSAFVALEAILAYIKVWYFVQPFRVSGALVLMIENIVRDCLTFLGLALIVMLGFASSLHILYRDVVHVQDDDEDRKDVKDAFRTFPLSFSTLFYALFGNIEVQVYQYSHGLVWMIIPIFGLYMITQVIVLLNLLISIMSDTFDRVKSNERGQMLMARAMIIDSCETSASKREIEEMKKHGGKYICALESIDGKLHGTTKKEWTGRVNVLEERLKAIIHNNEVASRDILSEEVRLRNEELEKELKAMEKVLEEARGEAKDQAAFVKNKFANQDQQITDIKDQLEHHTREHASAFVNLEARMEQNSRDLFAKLEGILSILENMKAT